MIQAPHPEVSKAKSLLLISTETLAEPKWTIDRLLVAYLWIMRHASELDTPAAIVGKEQFAISRYLAEALYRVCSRLQDADLRRDIDVALIMKLTREQEALDK